MYTNFSNYRKPEPKHKQLPEHKIMSYLLLAVSTTGAGGVARFWPGFTDGLMLIDLPSPAGRAGEATGEPATQPFS